MNYPDAQPRVYIAQSKCPLNHCILAAAFECDVNDEGNDEVMAQYQADLAAILQRKVNSLIEQKVINPWCAICDAAWGTWQTSVARTKYRTMDEALPELKRLEAENLAATTAAAARKASRN